MEQRKAAKITLKSTAQNSFRTNRLEPLDGIAHLQTSLVDLGTS
jgi:hypothetical protein